MRLNVWGACAVMLPLVIAGCGGCGGSETTTTTPPTTVPKVTATTAATNAQGNDADEEYELDVIAEAEPDEGAPPLKVQFTASVEEDCLLYTSDAADEL